MKFIDIEHCYKIYKNGVTALADLTLKIDKGEFVFVIGTTGSGKSTLIKLLYREEKPTKGAVNVGGINVSKLRNGNVYKLRKKLGIVFQDFKLLPKLTVYENVAFGLENQGIKTKDIKPKVLLALERVGLKEKIRSFPNQLSGGEQQRVCIARAIVDEPKLLICDEPTGNLDEDNEKIIFEQLKKLSKEEKCVIVVSHSDAIKKYANEILKISKGKLVK